MNKQQLASKIWQSANNMRSKIEANEYKDYILGFIFYKFLSDKEEEVYIKDNGSREGIEDLKEDDLDYVKFFQDKIGYFISYDNLFSTWLAKDKDFDVSNVSDALHAFNRLIADQYKKVYEKQIEHLNKLILSIEDEKNYFHKENEDESLYYNQFEIYKSQIEQQRIDVNTFENIGYSEEQIEAQIIINQNKIAEIYYSTLASVEQTILQYKQQIEEINIQINSIDSGKTEYVITANASGILHLNDEYNLGMIIQASTVLGSISNELDEYHIEASVVAADYAKIENGEKVDIEVSGLPSYLFGSLSGKITRIDSDSTVIKDAAGNSIPTYRISIKPDGDFWVSAKGKKINLSSGMEVELYIQYDELTYLDYFLECIGVSKW